jgi:hypothetical protein
LDQKQQISRINFNHIDLASRKEDEEKLVMLKNISNMIMLCEISKIPQNQNRRTNSLNSVT